MHPLSIFDFTIPSEAVEKQELINWLKDNTVNWAFQHEAGEQTGYRHWQGRIRLGKHNKKRLQTLITWASETLTNEGHWSPTSTRVACTKELFYSTYVTKDETRIDGPWTDADPEIPQYLIMGGWYPWQQQILASAEGDGSRRINVIVDSVGGKGKSTISGYIDASGKGVEIEELETVKDLMQFIYCMPDAKLYTLDLPCAARTTASIFIALEKIKKGKLYDTRYRGRKRWLKQQPAIWVFTNKKPNTKYLVRDRWAFWYIKEDGTLGRLTL